MHTFIFLLHNLTSLLTLFSATKSNNLAMVQLLVQFGADVNRQSYCGTTALHLAICADAPDIVDLLLDHGAHIDIAEEFNLTPIFTSAQLGRTACLERLLVHARNTGGSCIGSLVVGLSFNLFYNLFIGSGVQL